MRTQQFFSMLQEIQLRKSHSLSSKFEKESKNFCLSILLQQAWVLLLSLWNTFTQSFHWVRELKVRNISKS